MRDKRSFNSSSVIGISSGLSRLDIYVSHPIWQQNNCAYNYPRLESSQAFFEIFMPSDIIITIVYLAQEQFETFVEQIR